MRPRIAVSAGDPNGIGPEVALKCLADPEVRRVLEPVLVGSQAVWLAHADRLGMDGIPAEVMEPGLMPDMHIRWGVIGEDAGHQAMMAVEHAARLCLGGECQAMVTAPISKEAISLAGYSDPGHTEFIARLCGDPPHLMMMVAGGLRLGLVTTHIPVRRIASEVTRARIEERLALLDTCLRTDFGVAHPRIAVLGLNPHAGDGGVLGDEESEIILPAMRAALPDSSFGPFPADGFFGGGAYRQFDAILAMYHDQGLVAFKTIAFNAGVNFTAGLPIVRTSPDHGTAFDIAGRGVARADSMKEALLTAAQVAQVRAERRGM